MTAKAGPAASRGACLRKLVRPLLLWGLAALLLWLALRGIPITQVAEVLRSLTAFEIALLIALNLFILVLNTVRWWLIQRSLGYPVPVPMLIAFRLAGFAVTYLTPGPQFGGEPLQVHLLHTHRGVPLPTAIASVFTDRLIDLLANFTFLVIGSAVIVFGGLVGGWAGGGIWTLAVGLLLLPLGHLLTLRVGKRPLSSLADRFVRRSTRSALLHAAHVARGAEDRVASLVTAQPWLLMRLVGLSAFGWALMAMEFHMMLTFLGASPRIAETISALTAARLSFLLPLPAGLGALEAGQSLATGLLGWGVATGIAASLVIRARDVTMALGGLIIGGVLAQTNLARSRANRGDRIQEERSP